MEHIFKSYVMRKAFFIGMIILSSILPVNGKLVIIPEDFDHIPLAINSLSDGDTIILNEGIYYENLDFKGKSLILASQYFLDRDTTHISKTIIDGSNNESVIKITNDEKVQIIGLSIRNGNAKHGGGICIDNQSIADISKCRIYDNTALSGGGIAIRGSSKPVIKDCEIYNNKAVGLCVDGTHGGGVMAGNYSKGRLFNCHIYNNYTDCAGGGIYVISNPIGSQYRFSLSIDHCIINNNEAKEGGGLSGWRGCNVKITNSVFYKNNAIEGPEIYLYDGNITVVNSIICHDLSGATSSIYIEKPGCCTLWSSLEAYFDYNLIFGGIEAFAIVGDSVKLFYEENNLSNNPELNEDFSLSEGSPCIDAGIAFLSIPYDTLDNQQILVGDTIINLNPIEYFGEAPDIGAKEFSYDRHILFGKIVLTPNPCINNPCIPGMVYAVEINNFHVILSIEKSWNWSEIPLIVNGERFELNDSIKVIGTVFTKPDLNNESYTEIDIYSMSHLITSINQWQRNRISIYPVPSSGIIKIEFADLAYTEVYNSMGVLLTRLGSPEIDLSGFRDGVYFLRIFDRNGNTFVKKTLLAR